MSLYIVIIVNPPPTPNRLCYFAFRTYMHLTLSSTPLRPLVYSSTPLPRLARSSRTRTLL